MDMFWSVVLIFYSFKPSQSILGFDNIINWFYGLNPKPDRSTEVKFFSEIWSDNSLEYLISAAAKVDRLVSVAFTDNQPGHLKILF